MSDKYQDNKKSYYFKNNQKKMYIANALISKKIYCKK